MKIKKPLEIILRKPFWLVQRVELEDGTYGVWKVSKSFHECFELEVVSYKISNFFNLDIVPETHIVEWGGSVGSLQKFIDGNRVDHYPNEVPWIQLQKLALFDMVINNYDRAQSNYRVDSDGHVWACDNGCAFTGYPSMSLSAVYLFRQWLPETEIIAKQILSQRNAYFDFLDKEMFNAINCEHTVEQKKNALNVMFDHLENYVSIKEHNMIRY